MGVKDLWNILSPLSERKPLFELHGKTIAIDLSCWVVDSQNVTDNIAQPKMYLRNLFFRTSYFLLHDISPIFVLEGTAPTLKHNTIAKRNEIRNGGEERKTGKKGGRTRFNHVLKECEEMLKYMGVTCVKGYGEAEAMCAYLNEDGLVDGCISQDSDCFLYGAKVVYRNFCTSTQGTRTTSGGSIDEYSIEKIEQVFNLGRNKMIALALLCGCDYDEGINGVGKEAALKLFKVTEDSEILERMKQWKTDSKYRRMEAELSNPDICTNCGHPGKIRSHTRVGCVDCGTSVKCSDSYKEKRVLISNELSIRKKALLVENFPNQELIEEFLKRKGPVPSKLDLKWKKPMIVKFISFMESKVQWEPAYAFAKIFPLMTRWQLINLIELPLEQRFTTPGTFVPEKIKKLRNIRSVASFEVLWLDKYDILEGRILTDPDSNQEDNEEETQNTLTELASIEPQETVLKCYPNIVEEFQALKNAKKKKPTRSRKKKNEENGEELAEKQKPERRKRVQSKKTEVANNRKIVEFVKIQSREPSLEEAFRSMSITPKRRKKDEKAADLPVDEALNRMSITPKSMKNHRNATGLSVDEALQKMSITPKSKKTQKKVAELPVDEALQSMSVTPKPKKKHKSSTEPAVDEALGRISITPKRRKKDKPVNRLSSAKKRGPQFDRVMTVERMDSILNGSLEIMFNQLTEEDFPSDVEDSVDMSAIIDGIVNRKNPPVITIKDEENVCPNIQKPEVVKKRKQETKKRDSTDTLIDQQRSILREPEVVEVDEFDMLDKTYVPLDMRLQFEKGESKSNTKTKRTSNVRRSLTPATDEDRFSIGIDSLLNGTDV